MGGIVETLDWMISFRQRKTHEYAASILNICHLGRLLGHDLLPETEMAAHNSTKPRLSAAAELRLRANAVCEARLTKRQYGNKP